MATPNPPTLLARLPGYDTAPDIYETPAAPPAAAGADATGAKPRTSTGSAPSTSARSRSRSASSFSGSATATSASDDDGGDSASERDNDAAGGHSGAGGGVSRRRLRPDRARRRFAAGAARVRVGRVDLSERVDGRRRGYRVVRGGAAGEGEEAEGLEERIARLRREVEECRVLVGREEGGKGDGERGKDALEDLTRLMGALEEQRRASPRLVRASSGVPGTYPAVEGEVLDGKEAGEGEGEITLGQVAAFDARLAVLEQTLGLSALESEAGAAATPPLLPALTLLDHQMSVLLSSASLAGLDALASRIRTLRQAADDLAAVPTTATRAGDDNDNNDAATPSTSKPPSALTADDQQHLHALYALLPALQSLAPTVPALLTRLRSLRSLHAGAAGAAAALDEVERGQTQLASELQAWRTGLERVEAAVTEASEANGRNGKVVETWVRELEGRAAALGR